jgi:hypothetical protein
VQRGESRVLRNHRHRVAEAPAITLQHVWHGAGLIDIVVGRQAQRQQVLSLEHGVGPTLVGRQAQGLQEGPVLLLLQELRQPCR